LKESSVKLLQSDRIINNFYKTLRKCLKISQQNRIGGYNNK